MVTLGAIVALLNPRKNRLLRIAQAAMPEPQFRAFRTLLLDEFGRDGLERDLERMLAESNTERTRAGQADACRKGGAP